MTFTDDAMVVIAITGSLLLFYAGVGVLLYAVGKIALFVDRRFNGNCR